MTGPLASASLFDVLLMLPFYIWRQVYPTEYLKGSAIAMTEFTIKSAFFGCSFLITAMIFGPLNDYICGIFPLNVADICVSLLSEPTKEVE